MIVPLLLGSNIKELTPRLIKIIKKKYDYKAMPYQYHRINGSCDVLTKHVFTWLLSYVHTGGPSQRGLGVSVGRSVL